MSKIIFNGVDYAGGSGNYFNPVIYSGTERKIGVWRDNKPLYQKTYQITTPSTANVIEQIADVSALNIDAVVDVRGQFKDTNINWSLNIYFSTSRSSNVFINGAKTYISMLVNDNVALNKTAYVTIQYTKTTDVAGSGDYNTYGVPTVHSSTSEQVVGTSLDNKPLYEKTLTFSGINVDNNNINIGTVSNLKELYSATGTAKEGSYTYAIPEMGMRIRADGSGNITLRAMNNATWSNISGNVKIRYTKTTD